VPLGDGSHALKVTISDIYFQGIALANFHILKPSGNLFGSTFGPVSTHYMTYPLSDLRNSSRLADGLYPEGSYGYQPRYYATNTASQGLSYVVVDDVSPDSVRVREFTTSGVRWVEFSPTAPTVTALGEGESMDLGGTTATVVAIDDLTNAVLVQLADDGGKVLAEKVLGPLTDEVVSILPSWAGKVDLMLNHGSVQVQLDAFREPFAEPGKVSLLGYTDVVRLENGSPWEADPRFLLRFDTCGHCWMLNEVMLENRETIELDATDNRFSGPEGYFSIVIDDFDGEVVQAWHFEDATGETTDNLVWGDGSHIDLLVSRSNRTVGSFVGSMGTSLFDAMRARIAQLEQELEAAAAK
jgi:hypothetical protein